jgi:hypothetical protein
MMLLIVLLRIYRACRECQRDNESGTGFGWRMGTPF